MAWWCNGYGVGLATQKVAGSIPGLALSHNNLGQVVHTRVPLLPSSIIWYCSGGGDAFSAGKVTVGLAMHHRVHAVYPSTSSQPKAWMSTPPMLHSGLRVAAARVVCVCAVVIRAAVTKTVRLVSLWLLPLQRPVRPVAATALQVVRTV